MQADRIKTIAGVGLMAGGLLALFLSLGEAPPKFDARPHRGLGEALAEEALKALGNGGRLTVITREVAGYKDPALDSQLRGFYQVLRKANVTPAGTNLVKLDPLRLVRVPPGDFLEIMRRKSEVDVIASLLGPPILSGDQRAKLGEKRPRIVAVCSGDLPKQINLKELFEQNSLHVAIVSRPVPAAPPGLPDSASNREVFDQFYQVITASNHVELSSLINPAAR